MNGSTNIIDNKETNKSLPKLTIGKHTVDIPVIQGGMGVGISMSQLAGNVTLNGGIGTLSATALHKTPYYQKLFIHNIKEAKKQAGGKLSQAQINAYLIKSQQECIKEEIKKAKEIAQNKGPIFINIMVATSNYNQQVLAACEAGIDGIVSGAGLPKNLPEITKNYPQIALIPILSTAKGVDVLLKLREKSGRLPDAIILEDPSTAGGHLGAANLEKINDESGKLSTSIPAVLKLLKDKGLNIPIIGAGGITDKKDLEKILALGASGGQLGTRFLASTESGGSEEFKNAIVDATKDDIFTYMSSAGLPARALKKSGVFDKITNVQSKARKCIENCLVHCGYRDGNPNLAQMCINKELIKSTEGGHGNGLWFTGTSAIKINSILTVKEIMETFKQYKDLVTKPAFSL